MGRGGGRTRAPKIAKGVLKSGPTLTTPGRREEVSHVVGNYYKNVFGEVVIDE